MAGDVYLVLGVDGERFGIDARRLETVIEYAPPVPLPGRPKPFLGALSHRGELLPVAPLATLVGLEPRLDPGRAAIAVLGWEDGLLGLAAERTHGLAAPGPETRVAHVLGRWDGPYLRHTVETDGERVHVLELDALLSDLAGRF